MDGTYHLDVASIGKGNPPEHIYCAIGHFSREHLSDYLDYIVWQGNATRDGDTVTQSCPMHYAYRYSIAADGHA